MDMYHWATFILGQYTGPLIQINNETEFKELQRLAKQNHLFYYKDLCARNYKEILRILELNYNRRLHSGKTFATNSNNGTSFLVEYSPNGFTYATLHDYDQDRHSPDDWHIITMSEILEELQ